MTASQKWFDRFKKDKNQRDRFNTLVAHVLQKESLSEALAVYSELKTALKSSPDDDKLKADLQNVKNKAEAIIKTNNPDSNYKLLSCTDDKGDTQFYVYDSKFMGGEGITRAGFKIDKKGKISDEKIFMKSLYYNPEGLFSEEIGKYTTKAAEEVKATKVLYKKTSGMMTFDDPLDPASTGYDMVGYVMEKLPGFDFAKKTAAGIDYEEFKGLELSLFQRCQIMRDLFEQLAKLQKAGYCHSDINPTNVRVYVDENGDAHGILFDFGQTKYVGKNDFYSISSNEFGRPEFAAPESVAEVKTYQKASDVFSMAGIAGMMFTGNPENFIKDKSSAVIDISTDIQDVNAHKLAAINKSYNYEQMFSGLDVDADPVQKEKLTNFVKSLSDPDASKRPSSEQAFKFFDGMAKELEANIIKEQESDIVISGQTYYFQRALKGRGQKELAGFYKDENGTEFLIKEDKVATCIQEGSAGFVEKYLPEGHNKVINLATVEKMKKSDGKEVVISMQLTVANAKPWDQVVFGEKRKPKTPVSKEKLSNATLQTSLTKLSHSVKTDLAAAIYGSGLAGDESLHTGQFMAVYADNDPEKKGEIKRLVRIDLGARERFALKRVEDGDITCQTSMAYTSSSHQLGKNYMDYLVENPDINAKYLQLCRRNLTDVEQKQMVLENITSFNDAFAKIPNDEVTQKQALLDVYAIYTKDAKNVKELINSDSATIKYEIEKLITECTLKKCDSLNMDATKKIYALMENFNANFPQANTDKINTVIFNKGKLTLTQVGEAIEVMKKSYMNFEKKSEESKKSYYQVLAQLYAVVEFSHIDNKIQLLQEIESMQLVVRGVQFTKDKVANKEIHEMIMPQNSSQDLNKNKPIKKMDDVKSSYTSLIESQGNPVVISAMAKVLANHEHDDLPNKKVNRSQPLRKST